MERAHPPERLLSREPLDRNRELQLRQKLYRHHEIPDDDVLLPTIWLEPVPPSGEGRLWGVALQRATPEDLKGAYTFLPIVRDEADLARLHYPRFEVDEPATRLLLDRARDLLDDLVPVKLWSDEVRESLGERIIDFLGWEGFLPGARHGRHAQGAGADRVRGGRLYPGHQPL